MPDSVPSPLTDREKEFMQNRALVLETANRVALDILANRTGQEFPRMAVVMLTTYDNPTYMARAVAGGAAGYLLKGVEYDEMLRTLRAVVQGDILLSAQELVRALRGVSETAIGSEDLVVPLTEREEEVLRLLSTGLSNRDMASLLFIAESTIKTHVEHILGKLGVSDRVQAAVWAARHGLHATLE
ncbi:MAG: nitrate/nitrite regulatory protein narP [Chthonomonadales bacterium]|nr:nitrate/nitrite regulatory protein narP [Chthonomonadales bacterium]